MVDPAALLTITGVMPQRRTKIMTKRINTRSALLFSLIALLLIVAALVGTTLAYFTDSVTSDFNKIVAMYEDGSAS